MSRASSTPSDGELAEALDGVLRKADLDPARELRRSSSEYRSSFPLEELDVELMDGTRLRLAFKRLDRQCLGDQAKLAKPSFLHDPGREPAVYESVLARTLPGPPRYYGSAIDSAAERHWLFVEWVEGRELYQVGELELWCAAGRWLGEMHVKLGADLRRRAEVGRLLDCDESYYRRWSSRAVEFARAMPPESGAAASLEWLARRHEQVVEAMLSMPRTVIHGEFYASNVLVADGPDGTRVAPVDWELAAVAPGLIDLAALVSGDLPGGYRAEIVAAYRSAVGSRDFSSMELDFARLHLAVQRLGWAPPAWMPPEGQRHDWLAEALALAEGLDL
jgi:Ser/Thr protein kinase RdoA (MazF antagonist)